MKKTVKAEKKRSGLFRSCLIDTFGFVGMADEEEIQAKRARFKQRFGRRARPPEEAVAAKVEEAEPVSKKPAAPATPAAVAEARVDNVEDGEEEEEADPENSSNYTVVHVEIVTEILRHYSSPLLTEAERRVLTAFLALSDKAQKLFVRLLGRKYRVFRCSTLAADAEVALLELQRVGFLCLVSGELKLEGSKQRALAFLRLLRVGELRTVAGSISVVARARMTRDQLLECLAAACCEEPAQERRASDQSKLSFAVGANKQKKNASAIEAALCKALRGGSSNSVPSLQAQSSLLSLWGAAKQKSLPSASSTTEDSPAMVSSAWIAANGFVAVLSHRVCAL